MISLIEVLVVVVSKDRLDLLNWSTYCTGAAHVGHDESVDLSS